MNWIHDWRFVDISRQVVHHATVRFRSYQRTGRCFTSLLQDTVDACCGACKLMADCNVFVWCGSATGCGASKRGECWLKRQRRIDFLDPDGAVGSSTRSSHFVPPATVLLSDLLTIAATAVGLTFKGEMGAVYPKLLIHWLDRHLTPAAVPWTSGSVYSAAEKAAADAALAADEAGEAERLLALKNNETLPLLFFDVEVGRGLHQCSLWRLQLVAPPMIAMAYPSAAQIDGVSIGRMLFVLFVDESPIAAENYRQLFTGERVRAFGIR